MKRNCNGCKARTAYGCDLGYETEMTKFIGNGHMSERKPLEECPKPKKTSEYVNLRMNK